MIENIIGREREKALLATIKSSHRSEFLAVYGRRRVGKTFLIREFFENDLLFQTAGLASGSKEMQLKAFYQDLLRAGLPKAQKPADWLDAFALLMSLIENSSRPRKIILLDELPWFDTPRSGFVAALEHFWNVWASARRDVVLIACGSATSWIMDKLINNHGGLHNRLTCRIWLQPLTLCETEKLLKSKQMLLSRYEIAIAYMVFGGIPYYLDMLSSGLSLAQNIDHLLFSRAGQLYGEFDNLYKALFRNSDDYEAVVKALATKGQGLTRYEIINESKIPSSGALTAILNNLELCGFIRRYDLYRGTRKEKAIYQLIDFYTLFHFRFLNNHKIDSWEAILGKSQFYTWAGLTFEMLVLHHAPELKAALGIAAIKTNIFPWRNSGSNATQIDLVVERADFTTNLCEIKFSASEFEIDGAYEQTLRKRAEIYSRLEHGRRSVLTTMITTFGVKRNSHSSVVNSQITLDHLFSPTRPSDFM